MEFLANASRIVVLHNMCAAALTERLSGAVVGTEIINPLRQFVERKIIGQLPHRIVRKFGRRTMSVDDHRHPGRQAIENGARRLATGFGAKLHSKIGCRQVVAIELRWDMSGHYNTRAAYSGCNNLLQFVAVVGIAVAPDEDEYCVSLVVQR